MGDPVCYMHLLDEDGRMPEERWDEPHNHGIHDRRGARPRDDRPAGRSVVLESVEADETPAPLFDPE